MNFFKKYYGLILVLILSFWAIKPFFVQGFFPMHDDTQVARVFEMGKALRDGMFPVRWSADLGYGYGYPIFNFYAPLVYYVGGFFTLIGFDALSATKTMMVIGILLSGIFMYLLAKEFWGEMGAIVSSIFYVYAPYHAVDIYVRGDVAEFWAYAFIPLVFYGLVKIYKTAKFKYVLVASLGYSALILSHNLSALIATPFLAMFVAICCCSALRNKRLIAVYYLLFSICLGVIISAFYWLPAISEIKYTNVLSQIGGGADFRNHFVCLGQFWNSTWGFGGSIPGCVDGMSFIIGKMHLVALLGYLITLILFIFGNKRSVYYDKKLPMIVFTVIGFAFSVFLTLELSKPIWESNSLMAFLQYPWRFLLLMSFFSSFLAGLLTEFLLQKQKFIVAAVLIILVFYFYSKLFLPQTVLNRTANDYTNNNELIWNTSKISDEYMPKNFIKPKSLYEAAKDKIVVDNKSAKIIKLDQKTYKINATLNAYMDSYVQVNIAYFPAWEIFLDNEKVKFEESTQGVNLRLAKGQHTIKALFIQTDTEKVANLISLIGIVSLITGIIFKRRAFVS